MTTATATIPFIVHDGGRADAGFTGKTAAGDCVTRAIAIAADLPYREVYDALYARQREFVATSRAAKARKARTGSAAMLSRAQSPRDGVWKEVYKPYLEDELGWQWTPTMAVGQGCTVHLRADELPAGRLIVRLSRHLAAVIDGVLHDTYDSSRDGTRCVYGFWSAP